MPTIPTITSRVWIATALLHRENPNRDGFAGPEIIRRVEALPLPAPRRPTLYSMLSQHCIANRPPSSFKIRFLFRNDDGTRRLYRQGDPHHPERVNGKVCPEPGEVPEQFRYLHGWYWSEYVPGKASQTASPDPILALRGLGKDVWRKLGGVKFIEELRSDWMGSQASEPQQRATGSPPPERHSPRASR